MTEATNDRSHERDDGYEAEPRSDEEEMIPDGEIDNSAEPGLGEADAGDADAGDADGNKASETLEQMFGDDFTKLVAERDEYLDSLKRLQADFDNYRKRAMRQQTEMLERASESVLVQLLPVLDALDLAEAHSDGGDDPSSSASALAQVGTLLRETLAREGLERIDEVGVPFDPTIHDAVAHEEADEDENGEEADGGGAAHKPWVADVMRAGYRLKGRVVRPAMVKVKG